MVELAIIPRRCLCNRGRGGVFGRGFGWRRFRGGD